ncbi:hypothetical protein PCANC_07876 [Puccinia coronata f. sp. avenae]|uniref:Uncharacterized protein n=1 Tax=Puccinia coronata f. sp. avenae TaxID=200324 RepID=A0A2N5T8V1_9BASI|nr:hypothetical protein PCASD_12879 [Puccinia coronata f. sp. avenae]PLW47863.1 hypothetical protein PCANC_07876 [Puccinia coronata f. sp. avenae]
MNCLLISIACFFVKPFQCVGGVAPVATVPGRFSTRWMNQLGYMSLEETRQMRNDYSKSNKRLILIGDDSGLIKPFGKGNNPREDQEEINLTRKVLRRLATDPKNEIWVVTTQDVQVADKIYGDIPNLNLAGCQGTQFGTRNKVHVELPEIGILPDKASQIIEELEIPLMTKPEQGNYWVCYRVPHGPRDKSNLDKVKQMTKKMQEFVDTESQNDATFNSKYKDYELHISPVNWVESKVEIKHKYYKSNKQMLAEVLFSQHQTSQIDFAMSLGSYQVDEYMHEVMKSRGHYAILVLGKDPTMDRMLSTFASHRLKCYKKAVSLLGNLPGIKKPKYHLESLGIFLQNMKEKVKVLFINILYYIKKIEEAL